MAPLVGGALLGRFWWGSVFLITVPLAAIAFVTGWTALPHRAGENDQPVDQPGGVLSAVMISALIFGINVLAQGNATAVLPWALFGVSLLAAVLFVIRERSAERNGQNPIWPLSLFKLPTFSVALVAGIVAFGGLIGAMFIGQQFTQNVLGYSALAAGASILPLGVMSVVAASPASRLLTSRGSRLVFGSGLLIITLGFLVMLLFWKPGASFVWVFLAYFLIGTGVGFAGPASARALTGSVVVTRAGLGSAANDLTRDFGGAIFQATLGAILSIQYASFFTTAMRGNAQAGTDVAQTLSQSFAGAREVAAQYPAYAPQIIAAARLAFAQGSQAALFVGVLAAASGAVLTFVLFPNKVKEDAIYAQVARASKEALAATRVQETEAAAGATTALDGHAAGGTTGITGVTGLPSDGHGHGGGGVVGASGSERGALEHERLDGDGRSAAQS